MSWGSDTAVYRTAEAMRAELPERLGAGPPVIKRNRGNGGQGVWNVETLASPRNRQMVRVLDATQEQPETCRWKISSSAAETIFRMAV